MRGLEPRVEALSFQEEMAKSAQMGVLPIALAIANPFIRIADIMSRKPGMFPRRTAYWSAWDYLKERGKRF